MPAIIDAIAIREKRDNLGPRKFGAIIMVLSFMRIICARARELKLLLYRIAGILKTRIIITNEKH